MGESMSDPDVFNTLAHEFAERYRRGERPALSEYADRYPELADEIRDLFPTLVMMEQLRSGEDRHSDPAADRVPSARTPPEQLGDYRILREIGRGGMGTVYEAVQESLGRHVALKVLSLDRQSGSIQLIRFHREAQAAALLHHTNIVPVFGVGVHEGVHYFAMQYIQGPSLESVLREILAQRRDARHAKTIAHLEPGDNSVSLASKLLTRRLSPQPLPAEVETAVPSTTTPPGASHEAARPTTRSTDWPVMGSSSTSAILGRAESHYFHNVARLGVQAADALAYAHRHGVVHRDIKPANLLLDLQGTLWVTDFGLAKSEGTDDLTKPGDVVGTLRYMAPERFQGKADASCDVYSLGITLYEMLALKPAFTASHRAELIHAILNEEPVWPRKHDRQIPRDLETIVLKAIAKNPAHRFANAGELARELGRFVEGRPIRSRPLSIPERLWRWSRRKPAVALLTLLAAILTCILMIGSTVAAWKFREQRNAVQGEQLKTQAELGRSLVLQARALRYSRQPRRRSDALQSLRSAAQIAHAVGASSEHLADLRDEAIATLALMDDRPVQTWSMPGLRSEPRAFSVDADRCVVRSNNLLHIHRLSDGAEVGVLVSDRPSARFGPWFVPGGRFLYVESGSSRYEFWDLERGEVPPVWPADVRCVAARADGGQVAALLPDGEVRVYDLPAMTEALRFRLGLDVPRRIGFPWMSLSEDGRHLALIRPDQSRAGIDETASGRIVRDLKLPSIRVGSALALSRNGRLVAIVHDRAISIYDVADGEEVALLQGHQAEGINVQFQPGGDLLASQSWDGTTRLWDPLRGRLLLTLTGGFMGWAERGSSLVIGKDQELILHRITRGDARRTIDCRMFGDRAGTVISGPRKVAYSPDGQLIAIAMRPGVCIARASDGAALAFLPIGFCDEAQFLPEGSLLTYNERGICRWPVRRLPGNHLRMGPPEPVARFNQRTGLIYEGLTTSSSGRLIGVGSPTYLGAMLLDTELPWRRTWLVPHERVVDLAISPDGRWAATASLGVSPDTLQVKVWDAITGQLLVQLPLGNARVAFSPDGRWLGVGGSARYRFFRTGSWTLGPEIDHGVENGGMRMAFHPGSRIVALLDSSLSVVRLVEVETGRVLASLNAPDGVLTACLVFSPDGRFLAAGRSDQQVDVWDLPTIRDRLVELSLATGIPDIFGGRATSGDETTVDRIEVKGADSAGLRLLAVRQTLQEARVVVQGLLDPDLADAEELRTRAGRWLSLGQWRMAAADYRASLARSPDSAFAANGLAWCLVSLPGRGNADEAIRWSRKALELVPEEAAFRNTLGAALYRAGRFAEAAAELEQNIARNADQIGYDWVLLSMCRQRLGRGALARTALDQALRWRNAASGMAAAQSAEFDALLQEAESVLSGSLPDLPADVFVR